MEPYVFSALVPVIETQVIRPKWWQFWKKDQLIEGTKMVRKHILLTEDEAAFVKSMSGAASRVFGKAFSGSGADNMADAQLELTSEISPYVQTSATNEAER